MNPTIRFIGVEETLPLRTEVLLNGRPPRDRYFPEDRAPENFHLGSFHEGRLIGIASFYAEGLKDQAGPGYRLRGMAVATAFRNRGVGRVLLDFAAGVLAGGKKADYLWCNARRVACRFYLANDFSFISDEFDIPEAGPHRRMIRCLRRPAPAPVLVSD